MLFVSTDHPLWVARDGLGPCTSVLLMVLGQSWLLAAPSCSEPLAQLGFSLFFFKFFHFSSSFQSVARCRADGASVYPCKNSVLASLPAPLLPGEGGERTRQGEGRERGAAD